jgi:uncharacterized lipoprotein YbaY
MSAAAQRALEQRANSTNCLNAVNTTAKALSAPAQASLQGITIAKTEINTASTATVTVTITGAGAADATAVLGSTTVKLERSESHWGISS